VLAFAAVHVFYDWDWSAAEAESKRAMELSPGESVTHTHFADYLSIRGRHSEAIAAYSRVLDLDPISRVYIGLFGLILYRARRYDESIAQCQKALEIDPHYANGLWFLALSLEQKGDLPGAIAKLEEAVSLSQGPHYRALLGRAYALAGEKSKALEILDELKALSRVQPHLDDRNVKWRNVLLRPNFRVPILRGGISATRISGHRVNHAHV
jgi:tetratricopeptide (TPR) repeat protein